MLAALRGGGCDLAVASRHSRRRCRGPSVRAGGTVGSHERVLHAAARAVRAPSAPHSPRRGLKILLDIVLSAPPGLRVTEIPSRFRERAAGKSKLDVLVVGAVRRTAGG